MAGQDNSDTGGDNSDIVPDILDTGDNILLSVACSTVLGTAYCGLMVGAQLVAGFVAGLVVELVVGSVDVDAGTGSLAFGNGSWAVSSAVARLVAAFRWRNCRFVGDSCLKAFL